MPTGTATPTAIFVVLLVPDSTGETAGCGEEPELDPDEPPDPEEPEDDPPAADPDVDAEPETVVDVCGDVCFEAVVVVLSPLF